MRRLLAVIVLAGFVVVANAEDPKKDEPKKEDGPKLKVGDPAPPLKADKWLQGPEVKEFASGKIYVVEFWATWCGPCIVMMPHMSEMQIEYRDKGVTFIGFSAKDPGNTAEKVTEFVSKRGPKLGYTFCYGDNRETYDAWMTAAKQNGIPCSYVVDQNGKIAYIGHPMYLDVVLPKVVAGTWSEADVKNLKAVETDVNSVFTALNKPEVEGRRNKLDEAETKALVEEALKALADFDAKYPKLASIPYFISPRISLLVKIKKFDEAKKMASEVMAKAVSKDDPTALRSVSAAMRSAPDQKELVAISLKAALAGLKMAGEKDLGSLLNVADAYFVSGDKAKAREYGAKAVEASDNPRTKEAIERMVKKYEEEKKEEKKDDKKEDKK
jgi:thiol-disulfide isomerase/thioredoxin